jgi:ABC-type nitrate/sulfonate/bicarbonate transport system ATPase subunit
MDFNIEQPAALIMDPVHDEFNMSSDLMHELLVFKHFSAHYPQRTALRDLSLKIFENETYAILGPSGCGKTTLLYAIANLLPSNCTKVGDCLLMRPLKMSTVLQDFGLFPWKTVLENTLLPFILKGKPTAKDLEKTHIMLKYLKLDTHEHHYPGALSGGQKQRVAIARSWLMSPDLLLLDEPFSALDALTREDLQEDVLDLLKQSPLTMIIVTHSIEEAVFLGKNIILLSEKGEVKAQINNESFGMKNVRELPDFYNQCLSIRKLMRGA